MLRLFTFRLCATAFIACLLPLVAPAGTPGTGATPADPSTDTTSSSESADTDDVVLQEVTVTARKVEESLQAAPVAVTAFNDEQLRVRNIAQPQDLQAAVPSLVVTGTASVAGGRDQATYTVRGLTVGGAVYFAGAPAYSTLGTGGGTDQGVFYDLSAAQIVAGPQGTLFGRTSVGGAVLIEPNRPKDQFDAYVDASGGNLDFKKFEGMVNVALLPGRLDFRLAGFAEKRKGYTTSLTTGQDLDDVNRQGFRVGLDFKPVDMIDSYSLLTYSHVNENGIGNVVRDFNPNFLLNGALPIYNFDGAFGPAAPFVEAQVFGATCSLEAARAGVAAANTQAFINGCVAQRAGILTAAGKEYAAAAAATAAGDVRHAYTSEPNLSAHTHYQAINNTVFDLGDIGFISKSTIKNILAYGWSDTQFQGFNNLDGSSYNILAIAEGPVNGTVPGTCVASGPNIGTCTAAPQQRDPASSQPTQFSEEVNVSAKFAGKLDLLAGYFYLGQKQGVQRALAYNIYGNTLFPFGLAPLAFVSGPGTAFTRNYEHGELINGTLDLSEWIVRGLSLNAGFRHSTTASENAPFLTGNSGPIGAINSTTGQGNNRSVTLDWQINDRTLAYVRSGTGFQPGGTNPNCIAAGSPPGCPADYAPEKVTDYEVGTKLDYNLADLRLRTNLAIYKSNFNDIQKQEIISIAGAPANIQENVAKARIQGIELDQTVAYKGASLTATYSLTDAKYERWFGSATGFPCTDPVNNSANDCFNFSNTPFQLTARTKGSVLVRWVLPTPGAWGELIPSLSANYRSGVLYGNSIQIDPFSTTGGYTLFNARVDWRNIFGSALDAAIFARNLGNKIYETELNPLYNNTLFGFNTVQYGEPRVYGLELRYRFGASAR